MGSAIHLYAGDRFGRLEVIDFAYIDQRGEYHYECLCDCGNVKTVRSSHLRYGSISSCGCLMRTHAVTHGQASGRTVTPTYSAWRGMVARCANPENPQFRYHAGLGITVCERWDPKQGGSFENFLTDMGEKPEWATGGLDRYPDNTGNYEPGNCRWATRSQQNSNLRPMSAEGHARMSAAQFARFAAQPVSAETRARQSASAKARRKRERNQV